MQRSSWALRRKLMSRKRWPRFRRVIIQSVALVRRHPWRASLLVRFAWGLRLPLPFSLAHINVWALADQGVEIIDTAGVGGTSWARIEAERAGDLEIGELFAGWGLPTPLSIQQVRQAEGITTVIASGGLRNGLDAAKALALGADLVGMAWPFLAPATESPDRVAEKVRRIVQELKICMFCLGVKTVAELRTVPLRKGS